MVRINFKTIDRRTFHVDVDLSITVEALIERLAEHGIGAGAKLAYAGKVLKPKDTLATYGLSEGKMVIVATQGKPVSKPMASKPTPTTPATPAPVPAGASQTIADTPNTQPSTAASTDAPRKKDKTAVQEETADPNTSTMDVTMESEAPESTAMSASGATMITPADPKFTETVSMLCEMTGADAEKVKRALAVSYNNPDRAAEILFSGAPLPSRAEIERAQNPTEQPAGENANASASASMTASQGAAMQLLMQPQFRMLQEAVQENPASLEPLLEQLGNENPDLLRLLNDNQDFFLEFLNQPAGGGGGPGTIRVTPEEKAAIERLQALGFPADLAIQAYFACEKNEEAAANFLFMNRDF